MIDVILGDLFDLLTSIVEYVLVAILVYHYLAFYINT